MANRSAQESSAALNLLSQLEKGSTGRLAIGNGAARVAVYVRGGDVIAAEAADDVRLLVRRFTAAGVFAVDRGAELVAMSDLGEPVLWQIYDEVPEDVVSDVLFERFRDNVARFLGAPGKPRFKDLDAIFVDNIQLGHDPGRLVAECGRLADDASALDLDARLEPGEAAGADDPLLAAVSDRLDAEPTVGELLAELPVEPLAGRAALARLVRDGMLRLRGSARVPSNGIARAETDHDEPTFTGDPQLGDTAAYDDDGIGLDPPTEEQLSSSEGVGDLTSLKAWLHHGIEVEEDLEAFADFDYERGSNTRPSGTPAPGGFSTEAHNLDKVEVVHPEAVEEPLEADEAPQAKFSAPVLSEEEALSKIEVANECLRAMCEALDSVEGSGAGRAALQLLVDGGPARFGALFGNLQVSEAGEIPADELIDNLAERPASEHRALLNQGLVDLIERGLSSVGDELPDEAFDGMYERVSGYRQRLGL